MELAYCKRIVRVRLLQNHENILVNMKTGFLTTLLYCIVVVLLVMMYTYYEDVIYLNTKALLSRGITSKRKVTPMKYILQWTSYKNIPFVDMDIGQNGFIKRNCKYTNCFVTSDREFLGDYMKFDVVAFAGPDISVYRMNDISLPRRRSAHQKYVFASIESSDNYGICEGIFDGYFNWTWTYRLDSEVRWGYIVIRDKNSTVIGPKKNMNWLKLEDMDPVPEDLKNKLRKKRKAAVWFVSNCFSRSRREYFVQELVIELRKYKQGVDIIGKCGTLTCSRNQEQECDKNISEHYYFYLSFENSLSEDYVTEKLLRALKNDAVPIVYGGANYTRFMPNGIYLNAIELGVKKLAAKMNELINNPEQYAEYFKWKNHYVYHETTAKVDSNEYCKMCELLNDEETVKRITVYRDFRVWWNTPRKCDLVV